MTPQDASTFHETPGGTRRASGKSPKQLARELFEADADHTASSIARELADEFDLEPAELQRVAAEAAEWIAERQRVACKRCHTGASVARDEPPPWRLHCGTCGHEREHVVTINTSGPQRIKIGDGMHLEVREDAVYQISKTSNGTKETPVIAGPFEFVRVVHVEGSERIDVRIPEDVSGEFEDVAKALSRSGRFLKPQLGREVLAHLRHHEVRTNGIGEGRETYEVYATEHGALRLPEKCYPRPGVATEEYERILEILEHEPSDDEWRAFRDLEDHYEAKEVAPAKAACAGAPFARVLRSERCIVAGVYHLSTNSGVGKSKLAEAYSTHAWNVELQSGEDLSSDFRFASFLSGAATTLVVDEGEKFDWDRHGANVKKAFESETVTTRGTRELGRVSFPSRRVLLFTGNVLPRLPGPTLARLKIVRFKEDRKRTTTRDDRDQFKAAYERLGPVGPALARAALKMYPTREDLMSQINTVAAEIEDAHGPFKDPRRAQSWAFDFVFLGVWEHASGGIHEAPDLVEFVRDVVTPVENDTYGAERDRLEAFRNWLDVRLARDTGHDSDGVPHTKGEGSLFLRGHVETEPGRRVEAVIVTNALVDEYDKSTRHDPALQIGALNELARLVTESYPIDESGVFDATDRARKHTFDGGQKRAVPIPTADPDNMEF